MVAVLNVGIRMQSETLAVCSQPFSKRFCVVLEAVDLCNLFILGSEEFTFIEMRVGKYVAGI